jgi:hypothetical protein
MKLVGVISTAVLSLTLGVAAPAYAQQDQQPQQDEQKAKPAEEKKTQPEQAAKPEEKSAAQDKAVKPEEKNAQQQDKNAKPEEKSAQGAEPAKPQQPAQQATGNGGGRIPADRFKANFGSEHTFRVTQADYSNHRFEYGGYSFGFVDAWPSNWLYTQNVYVIDIGGVYYLCNPMYPGVNIALSFTL